MSNPIKERRPVAEDFAYMLEDDCIGANAEGIHDDMS
jgi:hypothetical protein